MVNLSALNPRQRQAVETVNGPVLILAGAGTGKTRVITHRVAYLVEQGVARGDILAVTFTNKAAREMRERVTKLVARPSKKSTEAAGERPTICTFHSLCVRILRQHIDKLGYKKNFVIYSESEQLGAVRKVLSRISAKGEKTDPKAILGLLSRMKNGGTWGIADPSAAAIAEHVRRPYESTLHACNAVDFDDLLLLTLRLFREHPSTLEACRARYRFIMVDEYQDTNAAQFQLVHHLAQEHRNLCVVGDDDQSIYGWRGAEIANLLDLEKYFPEVKVIKLEQNYRSTDVILSAANALIKNNVRRRSKQLWSENGRGSKILLQPFPDDEAEARSIVEQIEYARQIKRIPWLKQAILFRTNLQLRPLETALRQASVRYHLIGGQSYFDRREVKDLLSYLKLFLNPHDDVSLLRVANVPPRGLSDATLERLLAASQERKCSVFAAMTNPTVLFSLPVAARTRVEGFLGLIDRTRAALHGDSSMLLRTWAERFLDEIRYVDELRRFEKNQETAESRIRNLKELVCNLDESRPPGTPPADRLHDFLEDLTLDEDRADEKETSGDAVTLITMHSCKGLEFPHVYIVGLEDGLLPHSRSKMEGTLDEERRLFYVAITRAMLTLSISYCLARKKFGEAVQCHPSPFLKELPQELIEEADAKSATPITVETGKSFFDSLRATI
ncbi:MAG: ATP-dependent helicase [Verrucomicrobiia bacterium]